MSIVKNSKHGWLISHETLLKEAYQNVEPSQINFQLKPKLFDIFTPYKTSKNTKLKHKKNNQSSFETEVNHVEELYKQFYSEIGEIFTNSEFEVRNDEAINTANEIYETTGKYLPTNLYGANFKGPVMKTIGNSQFLFPENCNFYAKDVTEMSQHLQDQKYDLILLDPPWWNKYIRRKRKHTEQGYNMMYNEDFKKLPLENHLTSEGLIVVWCTNSPQHLTELIEEIFPKWGVKYVGKWYWVKVTKSGIPVCQFSQPPRRQPFEQIILGCVPSRSLAKPPSGKLVLSVPSALHSHKPPLIGLLRPFLPENPTCLEVFARYLLPNWTSYGKEVLKLQHESLYEQLSE